MSTQSATSSSGGTSPINFNWEVVTGKPDAKPDVTTLKGTFQDASGKKYEVTVSFSDAAIRKQYGENAKLNEVIDKICNKIGKDQLIELSGHQLRTSLGSDHLDKATITPIGGKNGKPLSDFKDSNQKLYDAATKTITKFDQVLTKAGKADGLAQTTKTTTTSPTKTSSAKPLPSSKGLHAKQNNNTSLEEIIHKNFQYNSLNSNSLSIHLEVHELVEENTDETVEVPNTHVETHAPKDEAARLKEERIKKVNDSLDSDDSIKGNMEILGLVVDYVATFQTEGHSSELWNEIKEKIIEIGGDRDNKDWNNSNMDNINDWMLNVVPLIFSEMTAQTEPQEEFIIPTEGPPVEEFIIPTEGPPVEDDTGSPIPQEMEFVIETNVIESSPETTLAEQTAQTKQTTKTELVDNKQLEIQEKIRNEFISTEKSFEGAVNSFIERLTFIKEHVPVLQKAYIDEIKDKYTKLSDSCSSISKEMETAIQKDNENGNSNELLKFMNSENFQQHLSCIIDCGLTMDKINTIIADFERNMSPETKKAFETKFNPKNTTIVSNVQLAIFTAQRIPKYELLVKELAKNSNSNTEPLLEPTADRINKAAIHFNKEQKDSSIRDSINLFYSIRDFSDKLKENPKGRIVMEYGVPKVIVSSDKKNPEPINQEKTNKEVKLIYDQLLTLVKTKKGERVEFKSFELKKIIKVLSENKQMSEVLNEEDKNGNTKLKNLNAVIDKLESDEKDELTLSKKGSKKLSQSKGKSV